MALAVRFLPRPCGGRTAVQEIELRWRNPTIHDASRLKIWTACAAHADSLADFLARRNFLMDRAPIG